MRLLSELHKLRYNCEYNTFNSFLSEVQFINTLTPRVKPWALQRFPTCDYMDRILKCDHSLESCSAVLYCGAVCFSISPSSKFLKIYQF